MPINNFSKSDINRIHSIVQNAMIMHPKEMIMAVLKDYFSHDSYYRYVNDEWGFNKIVDHTDLPLDAGINDNSTTRISIIESFQFGVMHIPAIVIRHNGSSSFPISINNEYSSVKYDDVIYQDGYGNNVKYKMPRNFVFGGAWEGSINVDILARDIKSRDDLTELIGIILSPSNNLGFSKLRKAGIVVKKISIGAPQEQEDRNDKIFSQSITVDIYSEWRREPKVGNIIEVIDFAVEFGRVDVPDYPIPQNLTIHNILGYIDSVKLATDDVFQDVVDPNLFNQYRLNVIDIELELGITPSVQYGSIRDRVDAIDLEITNLQNLYNYLLLHLPAYIVFANDLSGSHSSQSVIGLYNRPILDSVPNTGDVIYWNGSSWTATSLVNSYPIGGAGGDLSGSYPNPSTYAINGFLLPAIPPIANQVFLVDNTSNLSYNFIFNANVSNSASITGTKISPNFGSQNIITTGDGYFNGVQTSSVNTSLPMTVGQNALITNFGTDGVVNLSVGNNKVSTVNSGIRVATTIVNTATYNVQESDYIIFVDTSALSPTIYLPPTPQIGDVYILKDISGNANINNITLDGNGNTIEGLPSHIISIGNASATVFFTAFAWQAM